MLVSVCECDCCLSKIWFLVHMEINSIWRMRMRTLCLHPTPRETSGSGFYRRAHTWKVNHDLFDVLIAHQIIECLHFVMRCQDFLFGNRASLVYFAGDITEVTLSLMINVWLVHLESPLLFPSYPQKSLHFVKRMMEGVIESCLQKPAVSCVCTCVSVHVQTHTHFVLFHTLSRL